MKRLSVLVIACALAGCASSSGVYSVGPDTYRITATAMSGMGGKGTAKAKALNIADAQCAKTGKRPLVIEDKSDAQFTQASVDVTFRCEAN